MIRRSPVDTSKTQDDCAKFSQTAKPGQVCAIKVWEVGETANLGKGTSLFGVISQQWCSL